MPARSLAPPPPSNAITYGHWNSIHSRSSTRCSMHLAYGLRKLAPMGFQPAAIAASGPIACVAQKSVGPETPSRRRELHAFHRLREARVDGAPRIAHLVVPLVAQSLLDRPEQRVGDRVVMIFAHAVREMTRAESAHRV